MVVFTCQNCGESLSKQRVEKHYFGKCRHRGIHVTCVDCLKDFDLDYQGHTDCMTEDQRYAAAGTVFKPAKGKSKQARFMQTIQEVLNTDRGLTVSQRRMLEDCSKRDNVPRKIGKFKNFATNVFRKNSEKDVERVFEVIEEAWKSIENQVEKESSGNKDIKDEKQFSPGSEKSKSNITEIEESSDVLKELDKHDKNEPKKSKKKNQPIKNGEDANNVNVTDSESPKPTKSKNKRKSEEYTNAENEGERVDTSCSTLQEKEDDTKVLSKKELKKQKKYQKYLEGLEINTKNEVNENDEQEVLCHSKKNKNKLKKIKADNLKHLNEQNGDNVESVGLMEATAEPTEKKSKKRKMENNLNEIAEKKKKGEKNLGVEVEDEGVRFNWGEMIIRVLEGRPDKELSLKRLGKKVLDEYQTTQADHRTYQDLLARFNKKVNKTPGVRVLKDKAKLIE